MTRRFQTKTDIRALLADAGRRPRRRLGQNFLIDGNLMNRLLEAAEITAADVVLEVGTGTGSLTEHLVELAGRVVAVEIDRDLHAVVAGRLATAANLTLIHGDVLSSKHEIAPEVLQALQDARTKVGGRVMLVANLPYSIATPLLANLLLSPIGFARYCFTVQREVADRLTASPGTKEYGPISALMQSTCHLVRLAALPPQVFWPRPAVESTMIRADVERNPFGTLAGLEKFMNLLRGAFAHRRKTLRYNLANTVGDALLRLPADELDLGRRPESLTVDEWIHLARRLEMRKGGGEPSRDREGAVCEGGRQTEPRP